MTRTEKIYFERYAWHPDLLTEEEKIGSPDIIVVLPAFKEETVTKAVTSLLACKSPVGEVCILVVINEAEDAESKTKAINKRAYSDLNNLDREQQFSFQLIVKYVRLPAKKAGVGLARKVGMDAAARWFSEQGKSGIIVCFDADTTCESNYLVSIEKFFQEGWQVGLLSYQHPLDTDGIIHYELHLRYYTAGLRYAGFPFPFQTLGSCISVRSGAYLRHGGMNTRKAGEDFYFLHKLFPHESAGDITDTTIYPAARLSDRVPFGTGKALEKYLETQEIKTYDPVIFEHLKELLTNKGQLLASGNTLSKENQLFLEESDIYDRLRKLQQNTAGETGFNQRFFQIIDGFQLLKYVHYMRDNFYPSVEVDDALSQFNEKIWRIAGFEQMEPENQLRALRDWDREHPVSNKVKKTSYS